MVSRKRKTPAPTRGTRQGITPKKPPEEMMSAPRDVAEIAPEARPLRMLRIREVESRTGLKKTQIYRLERRGEFPRRVKISERASGHVESEVEDFIARRIAASRAAPST